MSPLNAEFAGFFDNARAGKLAFPKCKACGQFHWYPMPRCPHCQSTDVQWQAISGRGELYSFTSVTHAFDPSRRDSLPYTVGLVTFADAPGVRLITNIIDAPAEALRLGMAVDPVFPARDDGGGLVFFRPAKT
jgi:hypothetical protein